MSSHPISLFKLISTGMLWSVTFTSFAADGAREPGNRPPNGDPAARLAQMKERLKLTDEQFAKIKELGPERTPETLAKISEILTPEQREQMKAVRGSLGAQQRGEGGPGLPKIEILKEKLDLDESQVGKLTPKLEEARKALRELMEQKDLSSEQKREKARETVGPLMKSIAEDLNPEQRAKFREIIPSRQTGEAGARPKKQ